MDRFRLTEINDRECPSTRAAEPHAALRRERDLFESVNRLVGEIEALKQEREAEMTRSARIRMGAVYAKARLERRVIGQ